MAYANEPTIVWGEQPVDLAPRAGTVLLGRYKLVSLMGAGGTADVWAAHDEKRDRTVTIKLLRDRDDPQARRRFLDEGLWLEAIEHPGIVRALGRHDVVGLTLIVFEHVQGMTLAERLKQGPVTPREAASMVRQLAGALGALHAHGVLHMDLKPANIIVSDDGRVRLIDLGIADLIGNAPEVIRGTPGYAAPEVRAGQAPTKATDVYGLALIARELLGAVAEDPKVASVLKFGLYSDPAKRPSSARRFALALSAIVLAREGGALARDAGARARVEVTAALDTVDELRPADWRPSTILASAREAGRRLRDGSQRLAYAGVAVVLVAIVLAIPRISSTVADVSSNAPSGASRAFTIPPLSSYAAAFETEAPFPTVMAGTQVDWMIALRNTGTAGWFADHDGARATIALADGRTVATQSTPYVGPGEVATFNVRFIAPNTPGVHRFPMTLVIAGAGATADLGLYADVNVIEFRQVIGGRK
jgi:hypothetical protein